MSTVMHLAREEWRYWRRSSLAQSAAALFLVLLVATLVFTALRVSNEQQLRGQHQQTAESTFLAQPDRHPHRMVHYGHYVFRTPPPLALFDPGIDAVTGQSMFLEGHRQNTAMFAASAASAELGGMAWLTPALIYQLFAPVLLIVLGHGAVVRERESETLRAMLALGISGGKIVGGKALALLSVILIMLLPLTVSAVAAVVQGEAVVAGLLLFGTYFVYLAIWAALTLLFSTLPKQRATVLAALTSLWLTLALLLPSLAVNNTERLLPIPGQIETDLVMLEELRKLGDGHNAADPAFDQLRASLLHEHGVDTIEELPVNYRGAVAVYSEEKLTNKLNEFADERMAQELAQSQLLASHGWLTPLLAVADASRIIAATDLSNHHRFLREAEALRFDFVQGLNQAHVEQLSYIDDINRNNGPEASQRARVTAENWQLLQEFRFEVGSLQARIENAGASLLVLLAWLAGLSLGTVLAAGRLRV